MNYMAKTGTNNCYGIIIWKLVDSIFKCDINNCGIKDNTILTDYLKTTKYANSYEKLLNTGERQIVIFDGKKIIIQYINNDIISESIYPDDNNLNLLSCISHKIRNPLTNIIGILSLSDETKSEHLSKKYMGILKKSSYDIVGTANDLIDILNLYNNELKLNYDKIHIDKLLTECKHIVLENTRNATNMSKKPIEITININNIPDVIITDSRRLKQIIVNFLTNAVQHTSTDNIQLNVSILTEKLNTQLASPYAHTQPEPPIYNIFFSIENKGQGIDVSARNYLNYILKLNTEPECKNKKIRGFGLLINRNLCNFLKGNVWYHSTDKTTTFYFNILCDGIILD